MYVFACMCSWSVGLLIELLFYIYYLSDDEVNVRYSKLLTSTVSHIEALLSEEKRQLLALLSQEDTQVGTVYL